MIDRIIRSHLRGFHPYTSARSEFAALPGGGGGRTILLDANELSAGSPVACNGIPLNRYPDPMQQELRGRIAGRLRVSSDEIFLGVGSDEIIDLLVRLCCDPGTDSVVILGPTYGVYRVAANLNAVAVVDAELEGGFQIDLEGTRAAMGSAKLLFCCSPNNPTGNLLRVSDIEKLCTEFTGLVIVDQAYIEFASSGAAGCGDLMQNRAGLENLVILRTLSKGWGLAGIRLGYCIASPQIVSHLLRIKFPYNVGSVSSRIALEALDKEEFLRSSVRSVVRERELLSVRLKEIREVVRVYPSDANFLLVEFQDSLIAFERLKRAGIIVRRRSEQRLRNCLRITVGTPDENTLLVETLRGLT
ncbi:MAG TPA: histidinol-phosphate transaminase [Bacteroidota bacterium]|jgi:histidinol-phosphate aminotransferase